MIKYATALGLLALAANGCATEHRTVVVASSDACTRYGFTASTNDYVRCQQLIAEQRRLGRVMAGYSDSQIIADAQAACVSYGISRATAQYDRCVQDEVAARRPG